MAASTPDDPAPQGATARFGALVAGRRRAVSPDVPIELDDAELARHLRAMAAEYNELRMHYQAGIDEVLTKVNILRTEFEQTGEYSPIEHVRTRLKSPESLIAKAVRVCDELTIPAIREHIMDIAGIRITCSFVSDVYWIATMLRRHPDLEILEVKDYIANPKPNGYRSLHLIVRVPVYLSESTELIPVELQIRTSAQDFWASVEHKLNYKYDRDLPADLAAELDDAATLAAELDARMERLREEIRPMPPQARGGVA